MLGNMRELDVASTRSATTTREIAKCCGNITSCPVDATCRSLLDDDATKLAERILALFRDVVCLTVPRPD